MSRILQNMTSLALLFTCLFKVFLYCVIIMICLFAACVSHVVVGDI